MIEIILNEKAFAERALEEMTLGSHPGLTLSRIARYYAALGYNSNEISGLLEDFIIKCDPATNLYKWQSFIDTQSKNASKYKLVDIDGVRVTHNEIMAIKRIDGKLLQKLMFTLLCLAKYGNAINSKNNNWVNKTDRDIFSLANIILTNKRQSLMINSLWQQGYLGYSRAIDNINLNVKIIDDDSPCELMITDFRNLGNQYLKYNGEPYIECQNCGLVVKKRHVKQKLCNQCAKDSNRQRAFVRYRNQMKTRESET